MSEDWRVRAKLIKGFHTSKQAELGEAKTGRPDSIVGKRGWGIRDTAEHFNLNIRYVIEDIKLADFIDDIHFKDLNRNDALAKIEGKTKPSREAMLYNCLVLSLARLNADLTKGKEVKTILQETLKKYEQGNSSGPKKDLR